MSREQAREQALVLENKALWKLVETLVRVLALRAPDEVQNFLTEVEKLK